MEYYILLFVILEHVIIGATFSISSRFWNGDLKFTWPKISDYQDVSLTLDGQNQGFTREYDGQVTVVDVLRYNVVAILVRATISYRYHESRSEYRPNVMMTVEGGAVEITLPIPHTPENVVYKVYRLHSKEEATIIPDVRYQSGSPYKLRYTQSHIIFEIKNVSTEDAGFYSVGYTVENARTQNGVILVVKAKPNKPIISGNNRVPIGQKTTLSCSSSSRSKPSYYKKFPPLSYTWFINRTEAFTGQKIEMNVHKRIGMDIITCKVTETLESLSDIYNVEPLYGPESAEISPNFNTTLSIHDNSSFGPVNCIARCNPPCHVYWEGIDPMGTKLTSFSGMTLPIQHIHRDEVMAYRCVAKGQYNNTQGQTTAIRDIGFNIQYLSSPTFLVSVNGTVKNGLNNVLDEGDIVTLNCTANGNPEPEVIIETRHGNKVGMFGLRSKKSFTYTFLGGMQCTDTTTYRCTARNKEFIDRFSATKIYVKCSPRLESKMHFKYLYNAVAGEVVSLSVPVISYPEPKHAYWMGPVEHDRIKTIIAQRNRPYQLWISSDIPIFNPKCYGNYSLFLDGKIIVTIQIQNKDMVPVKSGKLIRVLEKSDIIITVLGGLVLVLSFLLIISLKNGRIANAKGKRLSTRTKEGETYSLREQVYNSLSRRQSTDEQNLEYEKINTYADVACASANSG
ncbi:uncharacterized protein LOC134265667 [Saccostrea cucullata]|uniref:uncharacterized protein LOC134265667 n=1 Tax=Saccostrea cuccullata TaxID=36930 RepID=UPI002ED2A5C4